MPEAHLSKEQSQAFHTFMRSNRDTIKRVMLEPNAEGYTVGNNDKAPMFIVFDTHINRQGEAKLYYPFEFGDTLAEAGVIFEKEETVAPDSS